MHEAFLLVAAAALSRLTAQEGLTLSDTPKSGFFVLCKYIAVTSLGKEAETAYDGQGFSGIPPDCTQGSGAVQYLGNAGAGRKARQTPKMPAARLSKGKIIIDSQNQPCTRLKWSDI